MTFRGNFTEDPAVPNHLYHTALEEEGQELSVKRDQQ